MPPSTTITLTGPDLRAPAPRSTERRAMPRPASAPRRTAPTAPHAVHGAWRQHRHSRWLPGAVLAAHAAGLWAAMQVDGVRDVVVQAVPMMVSVLPVAPPPPPPPAPVLRVPAPTLSPMAPPPPVPTPATTPVDAPATMPTVAPTPAAAPVPVAAPPATAPSPPAAAPVARVDAAQLQFVVLPLFEVPRLSKRLGERGRVVLLLRVDPNGVPVKVSVHVSSGYQRLDEQAVSAMRAARFRPYARPDGQAVEVEALLPVDY